MMTIYLSKQKKRTKKKMVNNHGYTKAAKILA